MDLKNELQNEEIMLTRKYKYLMKISADKRRVMAAYEQWRGVYMFMRRVGIPCLED